MIKLADAENVTGIMEYTTLGNTGMEVSRICLGGMSFGSAADWMLDRAESREIIERAIDLGINFFDTANVYSSGESEEILGDVIEDYDRNELVVGTKVCGEMADAPNRSGLSRKSIAQELDDSLERLGVTSIDLYQIHRWDYQTPIEVTLRALDDAVRQEKVRYLGASSMWTHQFAETHHTSEDQGFERFRTMQNHYNLVYRESEREMLPYCRKQAIGVIPWSPLAKGYLARPHQEYDTTLRAETDRYAENHPYASGNGAEINTRVQEIAEEEGASMAEIALAWLLDKEVVDAPIVGTTSVEHLEEAVAAVDLDLSANQIQYLEEPYQPVPVSGPK